MRRATRWHGSNHAAVPISIHALHEESDQLKLAMYGGGSISIHALHEESDLNNRIDVKIIDISIHALHEESDDN